jgi:hypothetical protein
MSITFLTYIELSLAHLRQVNRTVDNLNEIVFKFGAGSAEVRKAATDSLTALNHQGFHFSEWETLSRLLNVS